MPESSLPHEWRGHAVVQVGVPELEEWIVRRTRHYDVRFVSADPGFRHAHITVLAPLQRWSSDDLAAIAASTAPFDFALRCIRVFPNGCIHLPPEPDADFRTLTRRVWDAHPDIIPNGAPDPAPHLTLDLASPEVSLTSTRHLLGDAIPVLCRAEALELVWYEAGNCHLIERWPLGSDEER